MVDHEGVRRERGPAEAPEGRLVAALDVEVLRVRRVDRRGPVAEVDPVGAAHARGRADVELVGRPEAAGDPDAHGAGVGVVDVVAADGPVEILEVLPEHVGRHGLQVALRVGDHDEVVVLVVAGLRVEVAHAHAPAHVELHARALLGGRSDADVEELPVHHGDLAVGAAVAVHEVEVLRGAVAPHHHRVVADAVVLETEVGVLAVVGHLDAPLEAPGEVDVVDDAHDPRARGGGVGGAALLEQRLPEHVEPLARRDVVAADPDVAVAADRHRDVAVIAVLPVGEHDPPVDGGVVEVGLLDHEHVAPRTEGVALVVDPRPVARRERRVRGLVVEPDPVGLPVDAHPAAAQVDLLHRRAHAEPEAAGLVEAHLAARGPRAAGVDAVGVEPALLVDPLALVVEERARRDLAQLVGRAVGEHHVVVGRVGAVDDAVG